MKYILVCGGVISGIGKGIVSSSIARILKDLGYGITIIKIDPYLNCDAGNLGPSDHGEVFVLDDGTETDLDLGNYERFLDITLTKDNSITSGKAFLKIIQKERNGEFLGKTVQMVPHMTNNIIETIKETSRISVSEKMPEVCVIELGGTVGDIESAIFIESLRQLKRDVGRNNFLVVGVDKVLQIGSEEKTKPIQGSIRRARELGISYDILICRSETKIRKQTIEKIEQFCDAEIIVSLENSSIWKVPSKLYINGLFEFLRNNFQLSPPPNEDDIRFLCRKTMSACSDRSKDSENTRNDTSRKEEECMEHRRLEKRYGELGMYWHWGLVLPKKEIGKIAIVGKYSNDVDSYISLVESLKFSASSLNLHVNLDILNVEDESVIEGLSKYDGVVMPGGYGPRGVEEMIEVVRHLREKRKTCLGICLGMQVLAIEFCRNVAMLKNANSEEFMETDETSAVVVEGRCLRIGKKQVIIEKKSKLGEIYGKTEIEERFRHRYTLKKDVILAMKKYGMKISGTSEDRESIDAIEIETHPFFLGVQYHPEFLSRPSKPHPIFVSFIKSALGIEENK